MDRTILMSRLMVIVVELKAKGMMMAIHYFRIVVLAFLLVASIYGQAYAVDNNKLMAALVKAYPEFLAGHDSDDLIWKDGTRMRFDDDRTDKNFETLLNAPSIKDMFYARYMPGIMSDVPDIDIDPGRIRYEPFFTKMYGDCKKGEPSRFLVEIVWLPRKWGKKIRITRVNGVAEQLSKVSHELDLLPPEFDKYLFPPAGTMNCRPIAGTKRQSAHGCAIAIDIAQKYSDYWRWAKPGTGGHYKYRNRIPYEIVQIFEKHGFIWGGKWYHYDTMHFEYRPELLIQ